MNKMHLKLGLLSKIARIFVFFASFLLIFSESYSQSGKLSSQETQQLNSLLQQASSLQNISPQQAYDYSLQVYRQARRNSLFKARALTLMGSIEAFKLDEPKDALDHHQEAYNLYHELFKAGQVSKTYLNTFLNTYAIPAYQFISDRAEKKKKYRRAIARYPRLSSDYVDFLAEVASTTQGQLRTQNQELIEKELSEQKLILEKIELTGDLELKELEALALSDSLLKRELALTKEKSRSDQLAKEKAEHKAEVAQQRMISISLMLSILFIITVAWLIWQNLRKQRRVNNLLNQKNQEINQQKEEIQTQRDSIEEQNQALQHQKEEIEAQRDNIEEQNQILQEQTREITVQRDQSDKLLLNILPEEVAEELKMSGSSSPRHYEQATVLFTDFKGFTQIAETLRPSELVKELDTCFLAFDEIIEKNDLEKIKTIGDAYMCAGGIPVPNQTNPIDAVKAGLAMQEFMHEFNAYKRAEGKLIWELRVGIHTGPLVAGVIGKHKFAYDVWGDTVNLAARMESSGEAGKVNISGATFELVQDYFNCSYRGKVQAKNKGSVDMYFAQANNLMMGQNQVSKFMNWAS